MTKEVMQQAFDLIERLNMRGFILADFETEVYATLGSLKAALEQPEPLEYWNAVEGWVKIDEVQKHFDAVNCGTIYKHGGEGRVPLYTTPPQRPWVGLTDEEMSDIVADIDADFGDLLWKVVCLTKIIQAELKERNA